MAGIDRRPMRVVFALAVSLAASAAWALEDAFPKAASAYLVLRDGRPLWGASVERRLPPASLAKMMTALLALEAGTLDREATVSRAAAAETGKRLGLKAGERVKAANLLAATVIGSANDACLALAEHVGGTRERFVATMNDRARALGLANTHFADPCGHDRKGQFSTAEDLAKLASAVSGRPEYLKLAALRRASLRTANGSREIAFTNTNALLGRYPGVLGLKTGYTEGAGTCVVALVERDGTRVMLIMLHASERWWDAVAILERAFDAPK
jgi:D-alanyl-D-alanine carboxypeptidase (penicillin-binding protein 5/6)